MLAAGTLGLHYEPGMRILEGKKNVELRGFCLPCSWIMIYCTHSKYRWFSPFAIRIADHVKFASYAQMSSFLDQNTEICLGFSANTCSNFNYRRPILNIISDVAFISNPPRDIPKGRGIRYFKQSNGGRKLRKLAVELIG